MIYNKVEYGVTFVCTVFIVYSIMKKAYQFRLEEAESKIFDRILKEEERTASEMTRIIVKRYIRFRRTKTQRGDITISKALLRSRHDGIKKSETVKIAEKDASYIISEMKKQEKKLVFDEIIKRITEWNIESKLRFEVETVENNTLISQFHELGERWSEIQCRMYCKMFVLIGCTIISKDWTETTFSFEVTRN